MGARLIGCKDSRGFNEAGAIMPRSGRPTVTAARPARNSFNEAGAIMPRSGRRAPGFNRRRSGASMRPGQSCPGVASQSRDHETLRERASMRPGQSCPGVAPDRYAPSDTRKHCFNEAGAIMPRSGGSESGGPRGGRARASMRPGQSCPGVGITLREHDGYPS